MHSPNLQPLKLRQHYRPQHYRPQADRLPRWLHRVWAWF